MSFILDTSTACPGVDNRQIINRPVSVTTERRLLAPAVGVLVTVAVGARVGPLVAAVAATGLVAA